MAATVDRIVRMRGGRIRKLLSVIPDPPAGLRDRAIILTLTLTGRRRAEVLNMTVGDLTIEAGMVWYRYRGKGNKQGKRALPQPADVALTAALAAFGRDIADPWPGCVAVAVQRGRQGRQVEDFLWQPPPLPEGEQLAARRRAHIPTSSEAPARCG